MLYLYRGWNSGTNQAVLDAWRRAMPEMEIEAFDVAARVFPNWRSKACALPHALRQDGVDAILGGRERYGDAVKRSKWYMERLVEEIDALQRSKDFDFSLGVGPLIFNLKPRQPHFVYTDGTMRATSHFPGGDSRLRFWQECIPYEEESLQEASRVFAMSEYMRKSLVEQYGLPEENVIKVNGGCNAPAPRQPQAGRFARKAVLFVGVEWERKGGPQLIEAFRRVRKRHPRASLDIVGCTPSLCEPGVRIAGRVSQEEVAEYLAKATCFCMVSRREPFGIAYLEAMRAGLPVIASDLGAMPDFVFNGVTGYRITYRDVDGLTERLDDLLSDPAKCQQMGERGRSLVESEYTWESTQRKMWDAIHAYLLRSAHSRTDS